MSASVLRNVAMGLALGGLGAFAVGQAVPWGGADVNIFFASMEFDVYPWGAHYDLNAFEESKEEWTNWYSGDAEPQDEETDEAPVVEVRYSTPYFSAVEAEVNLELRLPAEEFAKGARETATVALAVERATGIEKVTVDGLQVVATDNDGEDHVLGTYGPAIALDPDGSSEEVTVPIETGRWPGPLEVTVRADVVAEAAADAGQPVEASDTDTFGQFGEGVGFMSGALRVTTRSASDLWVTGEPRQVTVEVALEEADNVDRVVVTAMSFQDEGQTLSTDPKDVTLDVVGEEGTYTFSVALDEEGSASLAGKPAYTVHYADGNSTAFAADGTSFSFGAIDVEAVARLQPLEEGFFPQTIRVDYESSPSGDAWLTVLRLSHPVELAGMAVAAVGAVLARRSGPTVATRATLAAATGTLLLAFLMFTLGVENSIADKMGSWFDWSFGFVLGILGLLSLLAATIVAFVHARLATAPSPAAPNPAMPAQRPPVAPSPANPAMQARRPPTPPNQPPQRRP